MRENTAARRRRIPVQIRRSALVWVFVRESPGVSKAGHSGIEINCNYVKSGGFVLVLP